MMKKTDKNLTLLSRKKHKRDEENRIILNMHVKDDTNILSVFSENDEPVISTEIADFLENITQSIHSDEKFALHIKSDCIDSEEQKLYEKAIKQYYTEKYIAVDRELKHYNRVALVLSLIGIFVLAVSIFIEYSRQSILWSEVIDIVAWVFLWEAVDIKFFQIRKLKENRKRYAAFVDMKIRYEDA